MTFASSQLDLVVGLDIHMELVPIVGVPTPVPFPMPYLGMIEYTPGGLLLSVGISAVTSWAFSTPPTGPVLVNSLQATKTGDEAKNTKTLPHIVIPPGVQWTPLPRPLKLKVRPPPPDVESPAAPPGDAIFITGSKTVLFERSNACRLLDIAMSCSDPLRMPISTLIAVPKGLPVIVGGPPALDYKAAAKAFFLRNKWTAGLLREFAFLASGRLRSVLTWVACTLTGHPVDVGTGRLLTRAEDYVLRGPIPQTFERFYSSAWAERDSPLGYGWSHTFDERIWAERGRIVYKAGDGRELEFHTFDLPGRELREGQELFYPIDRLWLRCEGPGRYTIRSADGLAREFARLPADASGQSRLTRIRNRVKQWVGFEYDDTWCLRAVRTSEGRFLRFEHDARGKLKRVIVPVPTGGVDAGWYDQVSFTYSAEGDLVAATDSAGNSRRYEYDAHLLVAETDRDDNVFYFQYDGRDSTARCIRTWGDDRQGCDNMYFRKITYDLPNHRTFVEDSRKQTTVYEMNELGAVVKTTDPHGATTTREFDEHLWLVAETDALGQRTSYVYDERGNQVEKLLANGATWRTEYNEDDTPTWSTDPVGTRSVFDYDLLARMTQITTSAGEATRFEYDGVGPIAVTRSDGTTVRFQRDPFGQITRTIYPDNTEEHRQYDRQGRASKIRDSAGRVRRATFDLEGRLSALEHPGGALETFYHSPEGDILEVRRSGRNVRCGYSHHHQLAYMAEAGERIALRRDSEGEISSLVNEAGDEYSLRRDACGRVEEEVSYEHRKRAFVRDTLGRVIREFGPSQAGTEYEYDEVSNVARVQYGDGTEASFRYDLVGRLLSATNEAGTASFERDGRGNIVRETFGSDWVATTRDSLGRATAVRSSLGAAMNIGRNAMGEMVKMTAAGAWSTDFERDSAGAETKRQLPGDVEVQRSWDPAGRPAGLVVSKQGATLAATDYAWGGVDQLLSKSDKVTGAVEVYLHDASGRLTSSRSTPGDTPTWRTPSATGDLYRSSDRSDRKYGREGALLSDQGTTYTYDSNGNLSKKQLADGTLWSYRWTGPGRLASVTNPAGEQVSFAYDALGRRVQKNTAGRSTRWLWDGDVPLHESHKGRDENEGALVTWLFEPGRFAPLGKLVRHGENTRAYSIVSDYLGTPREMFDEAGSIAWKAQLDIYGVARMAVGAPEDCPWRWPGQYEDMESGLYYNRFRYYDSNVGAYVSQDPIRLAGGTALYSYTSDPLWYVDPLGLTGCEKPKRYDGPKPDYEVNLQHVPGPLFVPGKDVLPADAEAVFARAVPDNATTPKNWFGLNAGGDIYRFSGTNGVLHFSGTNASERGLGNVTDYALQRLGFK